MNRYAQRFGDIFVIINPQELVQPAFLRAESIARLNAATLTLYCCLPQAAPLSPVPGTSSLVEVTRDWIERLAAAPRAAGVEVEVRVETAADWRAQLVYASSESGADLVVKTAAKHTMVERMFSATADWMLLNEGSCPILLVSDPRPRDNRRLLAAIKLKPDDAEQEQLNGEIIRLSHYMADVVGFEMFAATAFRGEDIFYDRGALAEKCGLPRDHLRHMEGPAHIAIAAAAQEIDAQTIVIGNPRNSEAAQRLIDHVDADLLILHS